MTSPTRAKPARVFSDEVGRWFVSENATKYGGSRTDPISPDSKVL